MITLPPEKLGSFYLGAEYDRDKKEISPLTVNYDARDLTTHAICVGMTGSGKTGLCVGLLEEAAIDKVPAIIIDPKGDMTNLLLQFQDLDPADFKKWINVDDAARKGMTVDDYAAATATKWRNGLADWGQCTDRIKMLKESVDYTVFTPGSNAGVPINITGSFAAPKVDFDEDAEMIRERIQGTVAALLGMVDSKLDPVRGREGILLANLFEHYWRKQEDLDLMKLIISIQNPPIAKLGVFDMDTFFPEKDRFQLAMDFNSLIASPQFQYWLQGEPLDIDKIYFTPEGKPRHSVFYIAHLSDSERMFFVTLLLNSLITWMRRQSGTTSLRSLLYFDEIFGYFPPTAQPPSKRPLMTILKQARAFGVGAVLVTQNPADIDYKGISNAGTWFIGKLQAERDKMRLLEGLQGAIAEAGGNSDLDFDNLISSLSSRVFLLHNVHDDAPIVFHTRWVMSYLRGPLTRPQVKDLMAQKKKSPTIVSNQTITSQLTSTSSQPISEVPPSLDPGITQKYFGVWKAEAEAQVEMATSDALSLVYEPQILSVGKVRFYDEKRNVDQVKTHTYMSGAPDEFGRTNWEDALPAEGWEKKLLDKPDHPDTIAVKYQDIPDSVNSIKEIGKVKKDFSDWLYRSQRITCMEHDDLDVYQDLSESNEAFRMKVQQVAREERDEELDELQDKYKAKFERLEERIRKEQQDLEDAEADLKGRRTDEVVGVAETIFSVFVKRRRRSFGSVSTKRRMTRKAKQSVIESEEDLNKLYRDVEELEEELKEKLDKVRVKWDTIANDITTKEIKPRRTDVIVDSILLSWLPYWVAPNGSRVSALK